MINSKKAKRFQFWINVVLILITLSIVLPFVLVFISSLTDENTLIRNGYSFFPEKFSFYAYSYIIRQGEKILRAYGITIFVTIVGTLQTLPCLLFWRIRSRLKDCHTAEQLPFSYSSRCCSTADWCRPI